MATYMDGMNGGKHNSDNTESTPKKRIYCITQSAPATQHWYYEVEAESEEEALEIVQSGDIDCVDYEVHTDTYFVAEYEYEVTNVEDVE